MSTAPPPPPPAAPPPPSAPPPSDTDDGPRVSGPEVRDLGRLRRMREGRNVAGVAGGIARHLDIDPLVVKVLFVVLSFFGGAGLIVYGACWLLVPQDGTERALVNLDERSRTVLLVAVGVVATLALIGDSFVSPGVGFGLAWPLVVIGVVVVVVVVIRGSATPPYPPQPGAPGVTGPSASTPLPPATRDPRRRGPLLFWFTAALAALLVGVVLTLDLGGVDVPDSAYPATVLAVVGAMLLLGAFYGRAGGLVALGLLALLGTVGSTLAAEVDGGRIAATPRTAEAVESSYRLDAGEIVLDLTELDDLDPLDGRTVTLDVDLGRVVVTVPDDLTVVVDGELRGDGEADVFGLPETVARHDGGPGAPQLTLEPSVGLGQIEVRVGGGLPNETEPDRIDRPDRSDRTDRGQR